MRAIVVDDAGAPVVAEVPEPRGPGLLVTVRGCGLDTADLERMRRFPAGTVLGHEVEGTLEDGQRVTVVEHVGCGECERCRAGHETTCGEFRWSRIDPGGFAERLRATHCVPLPPTLPALGGVFVGPLAGVLRAQELLPRGPVLVAGCGADGLLFVQVLRLRGDEVLALDPRPRRLERALALGAAPAGERVGAAVVCEPACAAEALGLLAPGGTLLVFAAAAEPAPFDLAVVRREELTIVGSRAATLPYFRDAVEILPSLRLPEVRLLPLERFADGVEAYRSGEALKVVLEP